jgi:hypothetical protein
LTLALTVGAFAVGGIAYASIPDPSGVIHGCYNTGSNPSGQLRVIDTGKGAACSKNEQALTWNQTGPRGPEGPQGPQGPAGPKGDAGAPGPTYSAGTGLSLDGSTNTFGIQGSYQLPQGCSNGQTPFLLGTPLTHPWSCFTAANADKSCPSGQFQNGVNGDGDPSCATPGSSSSSGPDVWVTGNTFVNTPAIESSTLATLSLPAGTFLVEATATASDDSQGNEKIAMGCYLSTTSNLAEVEINSLGDDGQVNLASAPFALHTVVTLSSSADVDLRCVDSDGDDHVENIVLTALKLGTVNQE